MWALVILGYLAIAGIEVPIMLMHKQKRELKVFWVLWALGLYLGLAYVFRWPAPNPVPWIEYLFAPLSQYLRT